MHHNLFATVLSRVWSDLTISLFSASSSNNSLEYENYRLCQFFWKQDLNRNEVWRDWEESQYTRIGESATSNRLRKTCDALRIVSGTVSYYNRVHRLDRGMIRSSFCDINWRGFHFSEIIKRNASFRDSEVNSDLSIRRPLALVLALTIIKSENDIVLISLSVCNSMKQFKV